MNLQIAYTFRYIQNSSGGFLQFWYEVFCCITLGGRCICYRRSNNEFVRFHRGFRGETFPRGCMLPSRRFKIISKYFDLFWQGILRSNVSPTGDRLLLRNRTAAVFTELTPIRYHGNHSCRFSMAS